MEDNWYYWRNRVGQIMRSPYSGSTDDRIRGECSGLPPCCIEFFIETWRMDPESNQEHADRMVKAKAEGVDFWYVPCPECLETKSFVEISHCDGPHCFCGQWKHRQLVNEKLGEINPNVRASYKKWRRRVRANLKKRRGWV